MQYDHCALMSMTQNLIVTFSSFSICLAALVVGIDLLFGVLCVGHSKLSSFLPLLLG